MSGHPARSAVGDNPHYLYRSILLTPDNSLAPFNKPDKMMGKVVQSTLRAPLGKLCNLPVGSIIANLSGAWSHIGNSGLAVPAQSLGHDAIPPPLTATDIQHAEPELSPPSAIARAGDILTHPSVARTLQTFRTGFTRVVKLPAPRSPIARAGKRPRTPFPVNETDAHRNSDTTSSSKRLRTAAGLPQVDVPLFTTQAAVSSKAEVRGGQTNLHQLVRWLTSYMYFLISNPDHASRGMRSVTYSA